MKIKFPDSIFYWKGFSILREIKPSVRISFKFSLFQFDTLNIPDSGLSFSFLWKKKQCIWNRQKRKSQTSNNYLICKFLHFPEWWGKVLHSHKYPHLSSCHYNTRDRHQTHRDDLMGMMVLFLNGMITVSLNSRLNKNL